MDSSREESPDWVRSFQAPSCSLVSLSSDSESSAKGSPSRVNGIDSSHRGSSLLAQRDNTHVMDLTEGDAGKTASMKNSKRKSPAKELKIEQASSGEKTVDNTIKKGELDDVKGHEEEDSRRCTAEIEAPHHSVWTLSSDSESRFNGSPTREKKPSKREATELHEGDGRSNECGKWSPEKALNKKSSRKQRIDWTPKKENHVIISVKSEENEEDLEVPEKEISEKQSKPSVSTSTFPLVLPEKVNRTKALVECEGESIDLSGDMGAVGRVVFSDSASGNQDMYLDLKGTLYKTTIVPSRTFCVVNFGQSEAKIEAIMNDFIQLKPQSNVYEAETMVEGTLEDFSFDSEGETDKIPKAASNQIDQVEGSEEQINPTTKGKTVKASSVGRKRGRPAKEKPQTAKKARKKSVASKKTKAKK